MFHVEEINPKCRLDDGKVTRKSVSSSFCGMLNRGSGNRRPLQLVKNLKMFFIILFSPGGTLYLGLLDDGKIEGFMMSADQMDHFRETVAETLQSYTPPVPRYSSFYNDKIVLKIVLKSNLSLMFESIIICSNYLFCICIIPGTFSMWISCQCSRASTRTSGSRGMETILTCPTGNVIRDYA